MENTIMLFVSGVAIILGLFGAFLPLIPGVWLSLIGLLVFKFTAAATFSWTVFFITLSLVMFFQVLNYLIPALATKKFGGSKYGVFGTLIGLLIGLVLGGPFGVIIGMFLGAFAGEYFFNKQDINLALKSAFGSFIGFLITMGIEVMLCGWILFLYISDIIKWLSHHSSQLI